MDPHFDGVIFQTHPAELARRIKSPRLPFLVVDVRSAEDRSRGTIPGAKAHRSTDLETLPTGADAKTEFFVVGQNLDDPEVRRTTLRLRELGAQRVVELTGGMFEWEHFGFPVARPGAAGSSTSKAA
jgi:rhodanese-related sulfurtransferase